MDQSNFIWLFCLGKYDRIFAAITNEWTKSLKYYNQNIKILIINQKYNIKNMIINMTAKITSDK